MYRRFGRQDLLSEVEGHVRDASVVVLLDALFEPESEIRVPVEQPVEERGREAQQGAVRDGLSARGARLVAKQRQLAEEVARAQEPEVTLGVVAALVDAHATPLDHVHRSGWIALAHDDLACRRLDSLELRDEQPKRLVGELREAGVDTEEVPQRAAVCERLEPFTDLRVRADQRREHGLAQPKRLHRAARAHGRESNRLCEQGHLAEAVAAAEDVEWHLLAVISLLDDARGARCEHVEGIGLVAFADDHGAERERDRLEALGDKRANLLRQVRERRELADELPGVELTRDAHARAPGPVARAR